MYKCAKCVWKVKGTGLSTIIVLSLLCLRTVSAADFDPAAPAGATIGTSISDAEATLLAAGYERTRNCSYSKSAEGASILLRADVAPGSPDCVPNAKVIQVSFQSRGVAPVLLDGRPLEGPPTEVVDRISRKAGADPAQCQVRGQSARCAWDLPMRAPPVQVNLMYQGGSTPPALSVNVVPLE